MQALKRCLLAILRVYQHQQLRLAAQHHEILRESLQNLIIGLQSLLIILLILQHIRPVENCLLILLIKAQRFVVVGKRLIQFALFFQHVALSQ
jgi:hypothetical protein